MTTIEPRRAVVTIYQGDYLDRIRHLERRYEAAERDEKGATRLLSDGSEAADIAAEHKALVAEADQHAVEITVQALGRTAWRELVASHPVRPDNKEDDLVGVNEDTFKDALVPVSIVAPDLAEDELDKISDADFDRIYYTAFAINRTPGNSPKALPASQANQKNDETSS